MTSSGLSLSQRFFTDCVEPIIAKQFPNLQFAAALIGDGSEVLGFDTSMSTDHDWGPRLQVFLSEQEFAAVAPVLMTALDKQLPETFDGWSVRFGDHDRPSRNNATGAFGSDHGVELYTVAAWARDHLALTDFLRLTTADWLGCPEQSLLEATAGAVFRDDQGELTALRTHLSYYPSDLWLYKLASQWQRIGEEQAFVGRAGDAGDDLGSRVIAARLVRDVMHLVFLIERRYAPYAKWLGTAFGQLPGSRDFRDVLARTLSTETWNEREAALAESYRLAGELQLARGIPGAIAPAIGAYHDRPFTVVNADEIASALRAQITDRDLRTRPLVGAVDQLSDNVSILAHPERAQTLTHSFVVSASVPSTTDQTSVEAS